MDNAQILKRIDRKLTALNNKPKQETWVKVGTVKRFTGWKDYQDLRRARQQDLVKVRKTEAGSYEYLLESIPEILRKTA